MRILVVGSFPADSNFANALNTIKMADGFAKYGHDVCVICREAEVGRLSDRQLRQKFQISSSVSFVQVPKTFLMVPLGKHETFAYQVLRQAHYFQPEFAYCRNFIAPLILARKAGIPTVAESHAPLGKVSRPLSRMIRGLAESDAFKSLVTIAPVLRDNFIAQGVPRNKVHILPDAVDLNLFSRPPTYVEPTKKRPVVTYSGHLYDYKGIPTLLHSAALSPELDYRVIGGHPDDVKRVAKLVRIRGIRNVELVGHVSHSKVPEYLWASDVLLLPPSINHRSAEWTSPMKLGEYLASSTPVVATRIPALQYWLKETEVKFVQPDDPVSMANGLRAVLNDQHYAESLKRNGCALAQSLSYEVRCKKILDLAIS